MKALKRLNDFLIHPSSLIPHPFLLDVLSARLLGSNSGLFAEGQGGFEVSRPASFVPLLPTCESVCPTE